MATDVFSRQYTLTDTEKFLEDVDLELYDCNIHIETKSCKYGSGSNVTATLPPGYIVWYRKINLHKLFFKNATAGQTSYVSVVGVVEV